MAGTHATARVDWRGRELETAFRGASLDAIRKGVDILHKAIKSDTPKSSQKEHSRWLKTKRKYPSGAEMLEPKHLQRVIFKRAKNRGARGPIGWVSFRYGYINMVIGKHKKSGRGNFMLKARDNAIDRLIPIMQEESKRRGLW